MSSNGIAAASSTSDLYRVAPAPVIGCQSQLRMTNSWVRGLENDYNFLDREEVLALRALSSIDSTGMQDGVSAGAGAGAGAGASEYRRSSSALTRDPSYSYDGDETRRIGHVNSMVITTLSTMVSGASATPPEKGEVSPTINVVFTLEFPRLTGMKRKLVQLLCCVCCACSPHKKMAKQLKKVVDPEMAGDTIRDVVEYMTAKVRPAVTMVKKNKRPHARTIYCIDQLGVIVRGKKEDRKSSQSSKIVAPCWVFPNSGTPFEAVEYRVQKVKRTAQSKILQHEWKMLTGLKHECILPTPYAFFHRDKDRTKETLVVKKMPWDFQTYLDTNPERLSNNTFVRKCMQICLKIIRGIAYLHRNGVVHRDIKPGNVFVGPKEVHIGDFGVAITLKELKAKRGAAAKETRRNCRNVNEVMQSKVYGDLMDELGLKIGKFVSIQDWHESWTYKRARFCRSRDMQTSISQLESAIVYYETELQMADYTKGTMGYVCNADIIAKKQGVYSDMYAFGKLFDQVVRKCMEKHKFKPEGTLRMVLNTIISGCTNENYSLRRSASDVKQTLKNVVKYYLS